MTAQDFIISCGTRSTLTGISDYDTLDRIQSEFAEWVRDCEEQFKNWQAA